MVTTEPFVPYSKPSLCKILDKSNTFSHESLFIHPIEWYSEHDINILLSSEISEINPKVSITFTKLKLIFFSLNSLKEPKLPL